MTSWGPGTATGIGSLPGVDPAEASRFVLGELPDLPYLPELPGRGVGADLVGRGLMLLEGLSADLVPAGWRLIARPGVEARRAQDLLSRDLAAFEGAAARVAPTGGIKVQAAGPWTLAATVELPRGDKVLRDRGACRDLADSLAAGLAAHVADMRRRVPTATEILVQLDEPMLTAVRDGHVRTASGFDVLRIPEPVEFDDLLGRVFRAVEKAGGVPGVHLCAPRVPVSLLRGAGARWVATDLTLTQEEDELGEAVEAGMRLVAGVVPSVAPADDERVPDVATVLKPLRALWSRLGLADELLATVAVSPTCGFAGAMPDHVRAATTRCREAAAELAEVSA